MKRARILLTLGIWVAILPYLGFPFFIKNLLFFITGLGLAYFGYILYQEAKPKEKKEQKFENFSENNNFSGDLK